MPTLDFSLEHDYNNGPDFHVAVVQIRLFPTGGIPIITNAILDTGAALTIFDKALADPLGIADVTTGQPFPVETANNEAGTAYLHDIDIEFLGQRMNIPVGFVPEWEEGIDNLLGMRGFFEQMQVAFRHRDRLLFLSVL